MKTLKIMMIGMALLFAGAVHAQVSVNVNLGTPPQWGPTGYPEARYYYLPDVEAYYDVRSSMFIYSDGHSWIQRRYLPSRYRGYDLYGGYKVVMTDYHGNYPYAYYKYHKVKYAKGYRGGPQQNYGHRPDDGKHHAGPAYKGQPKHNIQPNYRGNNGGNFNGNKGNNQGGKHGENKGGDKGGKHRK